MRSPSTSWPRTPSSGTERHRHRGVPRALLEARASRLTAQPPGRGTPLGAARWLSCLAPRAGQGASARERHADRRRLVLRRHDAGRLHVSVLLPPRCSAATGGQPAASASQRLDWQPCTVSGASMQCASLAVPLDYARPSGRKITLALSMVPATAPQAERQGDLLVNPGGPGGTGRYLAASVAFSLDQKVASEYNIIGFDPRGVGASVPALHCDPSFFAGARPDYIPANQAAEQALIGRAKATPPLRAPVRLAAAVHDHRGRRQGHGLHPGGAWPAADQLPGLLLRHLPGPGLRHAVRQPGTADGARQHRRPAGRLVRRQHFPGLRVRVPYPGLLRVDRRARRHLRARQPPAPRCSRPGTGPAPS